MANEILKTGDKIAEDFIKDIDRVMLSLNKRLLDLVYGFQTTRDTFDATAILTSQPQLLGALREAGYADLAERYVNQYPEAIDAVSKELRKAGAVGALFTTADSQMFQQLAGADFEQFMFIGESAMSELRFQIYRQAIVSAPLSEIATSIEAATVGLAKNGSPLANYSMTHARTAVSSFQGSATIAAGENLGAELWIVKGPDDSKTRPVCQSALDNPIRTKGEWRAVGYWDGAPGGWNCRHYLQPYFGEAIL